jgi:hypothetical protein
MNNKVLSIYSPSAKKDSYSYNILKGLTVDIDVTNNLYDLPLDRLFQMAARINKKRSFLFVSKVLGKHLPVSPSLSLLTGQLLAAKFMKSTFNTNHPYEEMMVQSILDGRVAEQEFRKLNRFSYPLPEKTVWIGFAETATALGHSVFRSFKNAVYYHTTREEIAELVSLINFEEEHSHATSHRSYVSEEMLNNENPVVLVDDEMTTGKTSLNIIESIQLRFPRKKYTVISLLDWRSDEHKEAYFRMEDQWGIEIDVISLVSGTIEVADESILSLENEEPRVEEFAQGEVVSILPEESAEGHLYTTLVEGESRSYPTRYLKGTGRFGLEDYEEENQSAFIERLGAQLNSIRKGENVLCLGTGEFMYIPMRVAAEMGEGVVFQSTTRSPIYPANKVGYAIHSKFAFVNPEHSNQMNFFYNIDPGQYDEIFLFFERPLLTEQSEELIKVLSSLTKKVFVVYTSKERTSKKNSLHLYEKEGYMVKGSYSEEDAVFLLKDISHVALESSNEVRENAIQSGTHYSEMLPIEYKPSDSYLKLFHASLIEYKEKIALSVAVVAEQILKNRGENVILASLARAGTPIGILIKRYLAFQYGLNVPHYSISIIRGRGLDENALAYISKKHPGGVLQFVDGWTGKGAIKKELIRSTGLLANEYSIEIDDNLAVLADPGYCADVYGTREDFMIPSACLNSTVSGLVSRTVLNDHWINESDFHGAKYYDELEEADLSNYYIQQITNEFPAISKFVPETLQSISEGYVEMDWRGLEQIKSIQIDFEISDINMIKPGVGETTRVLLRRVPWKILVKDLQDPNLKHIFHLAKERNVPVESYQHMSYSCCGLIRTIEQEQSQ